MNIFRKIRLARLAKEIKQAFEFRLEELKRRLDLGEIDYAKYISERYDAQIVYECRMRKLGA